MRDLIAYAKANPGKLNYAHPGNGSNGHLYFELFRLSTGTEIVAVPYVSGAPTIPATIAGTVDFIIADPVLTRPHWQSGKLTLLAIAAPERAPYASDIPLVSETLPGYVASYWYGLFVPVGTPNAIFDRLEAELTGGLSSPELKKQIAAMGLEAGGMNSNQFRKKLEAEIARWKEVVSKSGIVRE